MDVCGFALGAENVIG